MISCILPTKDRWDLLQRAVASARRQEGVALEIVVVDDGSQTAGGVEGARVLRLEGCGVAVARNAAAEVAGGEWLAFLDDDDEWLPGKLSRQSEWLEAGGHAFGATDWISVSPSGEGPGWPRLAPGVQPWPRLLEGNFVNTSTVLMKREVFREAGGFDPGLRTVEDWDLWLRAARRAPLAWMAEPLTRSWVREGPRLTGDSESLWRNAMAVQERHLREGRPLPGPWEQRVRRALADRALCAAGAAWRRGARWQALADVAYAARRAPCYCLRHAVRQGIGRL